VKLDLSDDEVMFSTSKAVAKELRKGAKLCKEFDDEESQRLAVDLREVAKDLSRIAQRYYGVPGR
jgi:hypothetical protein